MRKNKKCLNKPKTSILEKKKNSFERIEEELFHILDSTNYDIFIKEFIEKINFQLDNIKCRIKEKPYEFSYWINIFNESIKCPYCGSEEIEILNQGLDFESEYNCLSCYSLFDETIIRKMKELSNYERF